MRRYMVIIGSAQLCLTATETRKTGKLNKEKTPRLPCLRDFIKMVYYSDE
jgi:hypothetical protein